MGEDSDLKWLDESHSIWINKHGDKTWREMAKDDSGRKSGRGFLEWMVGKNFHPRRGDADLKTKAHRALELVKPAPNYVRDKWSGMGFIAAYQELDKLRGEFKACGQPEEAEQVAVTMKHLWLKLDRADKRWIRVSEEGEEQGQVEDGTKEDHR